MWDVRGAHWMRVRMTDVDATNRGAVFQVQRHVKHRATSLFGQFCLEIHAFEHARFNPGVVVANGQGRGWVLRSKQSMTGVDGGQGRHGMSLLTAS